MGSAPHLDDQHPLAVQHGGSLWQLAHPTGGGRSSTAAPPAQRVQPVPAVVGVDPSLRLGALLLVPTGCPPGAPMAPLMGQVPAPGAYIPAIGRLPDHALRRS